MSDIMTTVTCPECGQPLIVKHSRNNMQFHLQCNNNNCRNYWDMDINIESIELACLFYKQYYKTNNIKYED